MENNSKKIRSEIGECVSWLVTTVPSPAGEVACTGRGRHLTFSKHYTFCCSFRENVCNYADILVKGAFREIECRLIGANERIFALLSDV